MKKLFLFLLLGLFFINLVQAQTYTLNEELDIKIVCLNNGYCSDASFCNINVIDPDSNLIVTNQNMTHNISYFNYTIIPNKTGMYNVKGFCKDGSLSEQIDYTFEITQDGTVLGTSQALINILLILLFIGLLIAFYQIKQKVDFDKWTDGIIEKYKGRNFVKMVLSMLLFQVVKNSFFMYYLLGLPIVALATSLSLLYSVEIYAIMEVLAFLYTWGTVIIGLIFLSYVQEWVAKMWELLKDMDWGFE